MLTAVLSHDLRSPLNAVLTSALLIQRRSTEEPVKETAGRILSSGKRMSRMIEDMLDMARARLAGGIPLKREPADLGALGVYTRLRIVAIAEGEPSARQVAHLAASRQPALTWASQSPSQPVASHL